MVDQHLHTAVLKLDRLLSKRGITITPATRCDVIRQALLDESFWKCLDVALEDALDLLLALRPMEAVAAVRVTWVSDTDCTFSRCSPACQTATSRSS
jgi:hypothetical protein